MEIHDISLIKIVMTIKKIAKKVYGEKARLGQKGRYGTPIYTRIATIAYMKLHKLVPERLEKELEKDLNLTRKLGLPWPVKARAIREWRKKLGKLVKQLIKRTYKAIARWKRKRKSKKAIIDTTGFKRGRASSHYEKRIGRKKKMYAKVIAAYSAEVDAVYTVGISYDTMHDVRVAEGILPEIVDSGLFDGLVGDKGFDSSDLMEQNKDGGLKPYIDVRGGSLSLRVGFGLNPRGISRL